LDTEYATACRSMAPSAMCTARDRFVAHQAVGYLMRGMVAPTWHRWLLPQRLASYLEQRPQFELFFEFQGVPKAFAAKIDSDWAPEPGRRSVGGGFLFIGSRLIDGGGGQQGNRALSSAEAEFAGVVNGSARGIWLRSVMLEMGSEMTPQARRAETMHLWAQQKVRGRAISMAKIHAEANRADNQTKPLEGPRFLKLPAMLPLRAPFSGRTQVFGAMLAAAMLGGVVYRVCKAPMRFLKGLWELVRDDDDQFAPVETPPGDEQLAIVEGGISRRTQTAPIKHYWTWSALELRQERLRLGIYRGQLTAQMIEDLLDEAGRR
ncbi:unnamed protein product, partial [Prorocentrum cordatum]